MIKYNSKDKVRRPKTKFYSDFIELVEKYPKYFIFNFAEKLKIPIKDYNENLIEFTSLYSSKTLKKRKFKGIAKVLLKPAKYDNKKYWYDTAVNLKFKYLFNYFQSVVYERKTGKVISRSKLYDDKKLEFQTSQETIYLLRSASDNLKKEISLGKD